MEKKKLKQNWKKKKKTDLTFLIVLQFGSYTRICIFIDLSVDIKEEES